MKNLQTYIKIREAAEYLGVSQQTLRNWASHGKIRAYRNPINGYRLFRKQDLERILQKVQMTANGGRGGR